MGLAPFVQGRGLRIVAHPHGAGFMDDIAGSMKTPVILFVILMSMGHYGSHRVKDLGKGLLHVPGLFDLVFRMAGVETQYRYTIFINDHRVDLTIILPFGHGFASSGHMYGSAKEPPVILFKGCAIASRFFCGAHDLRVSVDLLDTPAKAIERHPETAAIFYMITAGEIQLFVVQPPGRIDMHPANTVFVVAFAIQQVGEDASHIGAGGVMQVASYIIALVGQAIGITGGFGVEQEPGALTGAGRQDHGPAGDLVFLQIVLADIGDACCQAILIHQYLPGHRVGHQVNIARFQGRYHQAGGSGKIAIYFTTPAALGAEEAGSPFGVDLFCEDR